MTTPRRIRTLRLKVESLQEQIAALSTMFSSMDDKGAKTLELKLSRQLRTAQKDLTLAEKMHELQLKQEKELEAYRIKLELKTINKLTIIDAERGKINELTEGYANARRAKKEEKATEKQEENAEASLKELERTNPLMGKAYRLIKVNPSLSYDEALALVTKKEEDQIADDGTLQELIQQNQQELREESRIQELPIKAIDDGLEFLDNVIAPPEKSFAARLAEEKK
jgi:hypothetical protein